MPSQREPQPPRAFRVDPADNVATMIDDAGAGPVRCLGAGAPLGDLRALEPLPRSHKLALHDVAPGEAIVKYGVRIGHATRPIPRGAWVHLHNCASDFDERSGTLDPQSGAPTDTSSAYV
jgi:hypothetical protein